MIQGRCHCGAVSFEYDLSPSHLTDCNCSLCRRYATLWAYGTTDTVTFIGAPDNTLAYSWGDKNIAFHSCKTCGCATHWASLGPDEPRKVAVNMRLADPDAIKDIRVRRFDGADSWEFLD